MNNLERWLVKRIFARAVLQGFDHEERITELYFMIRDAAEAEFTEDNTPTLDAFLAKCFSHTQQKRKETDDAQSAFRQGGGMSMGAKEVGRWALGALAIIGMTDFIVQVATDGRIRIIRAILIELTK